MLAYSSLGPEQFEVAWKAGIDFWTTVPKEPVWLFVVKTGLKSDELDLVCGKIDYPKTIRVDQGSEFISRELRPIGTSKQCDAGRLTARKTDRQ